MENNLNLNTTANWNPNTENNPNSISLTFILLSFFNI